MTRGLSVVVSGAEVGEQVSHTKQQSAGPDDKCRMRSEAFQSRQAMSLVAMGRVDGREPSVKPNLGSTQRHLREPRPPLHHDSAGRGAVRACASTAPRGQYLPGALTVAVENAMFVLAVLYAEAVDQERLLVMAQSLMRSMNQQ